MGLNHLPSCKSRYSVGEQGWGGGVDLTDKLDVCYSLAEQTARAEATQAQDLDGRHQKASDCTVGRGNSDRNEERDSFRRKSEQPGSTRRNLCGVQNDRLTGLVQG